MKRIAKEVSEPPRTAMSARSVQSPTHRGLYPGWLVVMAAFCGVMVSFGSLLVDGALRTRCSD
jgi:hypothetical protein